MLPQTSPRRENEDYGDQILTKAVKAGRRTYFFDVRATRADDYFLTITESRKMTAADGSSSYDRHKIFLYKEDFAKFEEALSEVVEFIRRTKPEFFEQQEQATEKVAVTE
ncbi:MAG: PUR family DNA/RNA-binding protein [Alistipes sp.]|nr:PUR family DNA/RNA-binding protein [Alistipes sp.]